MQAVNRLQVRLHQDSQTSSKPPSTDLLKKREKNQTSQQAEMAKEEPKRKLVVNLDMKKTRKGCKRIDRYQILRPQECPVCGGHEFVAEPVRVQLQQVATGRAPHRGCGINNTVVSVSIAVKFTLPRGQRA